MIGKKLRRRISRFTPNIIPRSPVILEKEVDGLTHRFLAKKDKKQAAKYKINKDEIIYNLYNLSDGGTDVDLIHSWLLHITIHELSHWAVGLEVNKNLDELEHCQRWGGGN